MALQHLRSSTADKRPTPAAMSDGQLAMNTNTASPGLFFKDSNGDSIKAGPAHVGTTAPNATPGAGGQTGNSKGELWLDTTGGTYVLKAWDGTAWRSVSLTGDFVETTGDTMTGALVMDYQGQVRFRETTANGTSYVALQAAASVASNKTITLPDATGTVVLSGAIANADINASAAIVDTKLATISTAGKVSDSALPATISSNITGNAATVTDGVYTNANATITAQHSHQTNNTAIANSDGGLARLEVIGTGGAAFLQFHRPSVFGTYFGLDSDNQFKIGGWSYGNASYPILHSANYNSYAPTLGGSGASGTWNINITGTAAAATTVAAGALVVSAGAVGSYQLARSINTTVALDNTIAGSSLQTAGFVSSNWSWTNPQFGGTWRCMSGNLSTGGVGAGNGGLWHRTA